MDTKEKQKLDKVRRALDGRTNSIVIEELTISKRKRSIK